LIVFFGEQKVDIRYFFLCKNKKKIKNERVANAAISGLYLSKCVSFKNGTISEYFDGNPLS